MGMGGPILVVKRESLFDNGDFQGFMGIEQKNYLNKILNNFEYQIRTHELEKNPYWQQPIPYVWILNSLEKKVFLYKRSATGGEGRLHNKYSGGVGGHIDKDTDDVKDPIAAAMMRELREEVLMDSYPTPKVIGFLNDDSEPVGEVHFGVVAVAETTGEVRPVEDMAHGQFYSVEEVEKIFGDSKNIVENWTKLSWPFVKNYLLLKAN